MSRLRRRGRRRRGPVLFLLLEDGDVLGPELRHRPVEVEHLDPGAPGRGRGEGHRQLVRVAPVGHAHSLHLWQICILQRLLYHILTPKLVLRPIVGPVHACTGFSFQMPQKNRITGSPIAVCDLTRVQGGSRHCLQARMALSPTEMELVLKKQ